MCDEYRRITDIEEKEKYLEKYYNTKGGFESRNFLRAIKWYSKLQGDYVYEQMRCFFASEIPEWDEDYFGDTGIIYYFEYPTVEADCELVLSNEEFYSYISEVAQIYKKLFPQDKNIVDFYIEKTKVKLNL